VKEGCGSAETSTLRRGVLTHASTGRHRPTALPPAWTACISRAQSRARLQHACKLAAMQTLGDGRLRAAWLLFSSACSAPLPLRAQLLSAAVRRRGIDSLAPSAYRLLFCRVPLLPTL
jgi:hypothetical protein